MATRSRRPRNSAPEAEVTETEVTETVPENAEDTEMTVTTEAEVAAEEAADWPDETAPVTEEAETEEPEVINTTPVHEALSAILTSGADLSEPDTIDFAPVVAAYGELSRRGKAAATRELNENSRTLLEGGDFEKARVTLAAEKATKAGKPKGERAPRKPADVTAPVVDKLASFQLATILLRDNLPEGIDAAWEEKVAEAYNSSYEGAKALLAFVQSGAEGDAPEVSDAAKLAVKIAFKGARKPYGARHDVSAHIEQVFDELPEGTTLTVTEIAAATSEEYGDSHPSTSAVSARLRSDTPLTDGLVIAEDRKSVAKVAA